MNAQRYSMIQQHSCLLHGHTRKGFLPFAYKAAAAIILSVNIDEAIAFFISPLEALTDRSDSMQGTLAVRFHPHIPPAASL